MSPPSGTIAITGSSGLLGSNLVFELASLGYTVAALHGRHRMAVPGVSSFPFDLMDHRGAELLLSRIKPAWIVHCAAVTDVEWCETHPDECMRLNADASGELSATAKRIGAGFVYISTDSVFDGAAGGYRESDPVAPVNRYAASKAAGEAAVLWQMPNAVVLRLNLYGWNMQPKKSLAEWVLSQLERGVEVPGFGDVVFSPVLVNNVAEWILRLMASGSAGIYHLASSGYCSKYEFAREIASAFGMDGRLVQLSSVEEASFSAPRPRSTWLCAQKISAALGSGLPTIRDGVERFRGLRECGFVEKLKTAGKTGA